MEERLQKILSRAGVASRRKAEELIAQGLVEVNGTRVTELGTKADLARDSVKVRGKPVLAAPSAPLYFALNKPKGCVTTREDPEGRRTVMDLMGRYRRRVYPVGRLDYNSEGLLLLTNDGDFADRMLRSKTEIPKTYMVKVNAPLNADQLQKFREGVKIDGRLTAPARIRLVRAGANPWYEVTITEGRNRQLHNMFRRLGPLVEKIRRVRIGPLSLGKLPLGEARPLTSAEVERFRALWRDKPGRS